MYYKCYLFFRSQGLVDYSPTKNVPMVKSPPQTYKPIPPPKPKNYRPPQQNYYHNNNGYQHSKSYSMAENSYSAHIHNGVSLFNT